MSYAEFLESRTHRGADQGFDPIRMPPGLYDFQEALTAWAIRKGRGAIFADCGLGKTVQELTWCDNVYAKTGKPVLLLTPLAVASQIVEEGEKFSIECARSKDGKIPAPIVVTNYERLHLFSPDDFGGVACDESSILKNFDGARKHQITDFMRKVEYRLLATATAAPNDYIELGTSSEALGHMGFTDMLGRFFKNDLNNIATKRMYGEAPKWRFKGHAEQVFWRWVTSWARACRKPSDLGFDDGPFVLPPLIERETLIETAGAPEGMLFAMAATTLPEQRAERKRTLVQRCEAAAELILKHDGASIAWCHMNAEGDLLQKLLPNSVQVSGADSDDAKEEKFEAFARGEARDMVTKPKIGAWGLNWQFANHMTYFPDHSYERCYQAVRRCWRFGQKSPVTVDFVLTEGERKIMENQRQKAVKAETMFSNLVTEMNHATAIRRVNTHTNRLELPQWL